MPLWGDFLSMFTFQPKWVEEASYQLLSRKSPPVSHKYGNGPRKMCIKGGGPKLPTTHHHTCEIRQINRSRLSPPLRWWGSRGPPLPGYLAWVLHSHALIIRAMLLNNSQVILDILKDDMIRKVTLTLKSYIIHTIKSKGFKNEYLTLPNAYCKTHQTFYNVFTLQNISFIRFLKQ